MILGEFCNGFCGEQKNGFFSRDHPPLPLLVKDVEAAPSVEPPLMCGSNYITQRNVLCGVSCQQ